MSKATITLEDVGDGSFNLSTDYEGGYQVGSMAHEAVIMICKFMDQIAEQRSRATVHGDTTGELTAAMSEDLPAAANAELQATLTKMREAADVRREVEAIEPAVLPMMDVAQARALVMVANDAAGRAGSR